MAYLPPEPRPATPWSSLILVGLGWSAILVGGIAAAVAVVVTAHCL